MKLRQTKKYLVLQPIILAGLVIGILIHGCAASRYTTGPFTQVSRLETDLIRGVSTKADVRQVLGEPDGSGSALLPTDPRNREVWFYQDIEVTGIASGGPGNILATVRQQILIVFFQKEILDGFMWYSNVVEGRSEP